MGAEKKQKKEQKEEAERAQRLQQELDECKSSYLTWQVGGRVGGLVGGWVDGWVGATACVCCMGVLHIIMASPCCPCCGGQLLFGVRLLI